MKVEALPHWPLWVGKQEGEPGRGALVSGPSQPPLPLAPAPPPRRPWALPRKDIMPGTGTKIPSGRNEARGRGCSDEELHIPSPRFPNAHEGTTALSLFTSGGTEGSMPHSLWRCCLDLLSLSQTSRAQPQGWGHLEWAGQGIGSRLGLGRAPAPHQALEVDIAAQEPHRVPTSWQMN